MEDTYRFDDRLAPYVDRSFDFRVPQVVDDRFRQAFDDTLDDFYRRLFLGREKEYTVGRIEDRTVGVGGAELPIRVYTPAGANGALPCMMMFHGGGFITGSIKGLEYFSRYVCAHAGCVVVSVGYRLAPQVRYPVCTEDCFAVLNAVYAHPEDFGVDRSHISVCGDSAGGTIAAVTAMMAARAGIPLDKQVMIYPCVDMTMHDTPSRRSFGKGYSLDVEELDKCSLLYVQQPQDLTLPYVSPLLADDSDLKGLAPAFLVMAGCCPLTSDCLAYGRRLRQNGVAVREKIYHNMPHSFIIFN